METNIFADSTTLNKRTKMHKFLTEKLFQLQI